MRWIEMSLVRQGKVLKTRVICCDCEKKCSRLIGLNEELPTICSEERREKCSNFLNA